MSHHARTITVHPLAMRELEVIRVADPSPGLRRLTLTGDQLAPFTTADGTAFPGFVSSGFDDSVRLLFPYPGQQHVVLPYMQDGKVVIPKDPRPLSKVYTVRRWDSAAREVDIEFVKHGVGIATTWAYRAQVGQRIHVVGPSSSMGLPNGYDRLLVAGDETALPAMARLLEDLPAETCAQVFIEIACAEHRLELRELPQVTVTYLVRSEGQTLLDGVRQAKPLPERTFAWLAGEQSAIRDLRRHLIEECGFDKSDIDFSGYWKRTEVTTFDEDPALPDPDQVTDLFEVFHEQTKILPPLAIRTAANLGVADKISRGIRRIEPLAAATGCDQRALAKLLRYLQTLDVVTCDADGYQLTDTGDYLTNDFVLDALVKDGVHARKELAFFGLEKAVRTGAAVYESVTGQDFAALRKDATYENALLESTTNHAAYLSEPIARASALDGIGHLVIHSISAGTLAAAICAARPDIKITIAALPAQAAWLRTDLATAMATDADRARIQIVEQSIFETGPASDGVLIVEDLVAHPDADASLILRRAAAGTGRILLVEDIFDTSDIDEHDAETDLLNLALYGSGHRTQAELDAVITGAGLRRTSSETVGWEAVLQVLMPA